MTDWVIETRAGHVTALSRAEFLLKGLGVLLNEPTNICLSGVEASDIAAVGVWLLRNGHAVTLVPYPLWQEFAESKDFTLVLWVGNGEVRLFRSRPVVATDSPGCLKLFTSGSTGQPKMISISPPALEETATWYQSIYRLENKTTIVTCLPATYNFAFIAGAWAAACSGSSVAFLPTAEAVCKHVARSRGRKVILANPLVIQELAKTEVVLAGEDLVDSGGAPLSKYAIDQFREYHGDLREGYGLTETASLTHFDTEGTWESCGTVGRGMPGVRSRISLEYGKPMLYISSPNLCDPILNEDWQSAGEIRTGDVAQIDSGGRLRLLGRSNDFSISGKWPRDTLDHVGPLIGFKHLQVTHISAEHAILQFYNYADGRPTPLGCDQSNAVQRAVASFLDIPEENVLVQGAGRDLLHSFKLKRLQNA